MSDASIVELHSIGTTSRSIATALGTSKSTVTRRLKKLGLRPLTLSEARKTHSGPNKGATLPDWWRERMSISHSGKKLSEAHSQNIAKAMRKAAARGERHPMWKGGITKDRRGERATTEYRDWREAVFSRDNWTCVFCGQHGGILHADHIEPYVLRHDLCLDVSNGRTLCVKCHRGTDTFGVKVLRLKAYLDMKAEQPVLVDVSGSLVKLATI